MVVDIGAASVAFAAPILLVGMACMWNDAFLCFSNYNSKCIPSTLMLKSEDNVLTKCLKKRDEICAKKHPRMHKIATFFHTRSLVLTHQ